MKRYNNYTKTLYKFIALVLCFALSLPCLVSCDKDKKNSDKSGIKIIQENTKKLKEKKEKSTSGKDGDKSSNSNGDGSKASGGKDSSSSNSSGSNSKDSSSKGSSSSSSGQKGTSSIASGSRATVRTTVAPTRAPNAPYASPVIYSTVASGRVVFSNNKVTVDASNANDGYIMARYTGGNSKVKLRLIKGTTYTYDLSTSGSYEVFPLTLGNGTYTVEVLENISGNSYIKVLSQSFGVSLSSSFAPFLRPNQYVNYNRGTSVVTKAADLCTGYTTDLQKLDRIYNFVINYFTYDSYKASTVQSGYLPNLNTVYAQRKGICFDYAAVMTAMLRSQNIPCKLVVGYASSSYHAWINVYIRNVGWINGAIYFNGNTWKLMDPTFASSGNSSDAIMKYIGNGSNYTPQYYY